MLKIQQIQSILNAKTIHVIVNVHHIKISYKNLNRLQNHDLFTSLLSHKITVFDCFHNFLQ